MRPEDVVRKAEQARQVLETPVVRETLDFMEKEIMEAWVVCPVRDTESREALWRMAVTTRKFRDLLRGTMEAGKLATDQIVRTERQKTFLQEQKERFFSSGGR